MLASLDARRKAQDNLIKALSSQKWKERNWELYLYGSGEWENKLMELIDSNDMREKIILKGHTKDVKAALTGAHLLLQITNIDAMPLAVIEAMSMAKPLVVSHIGDMPKWVEEGKNGWISEDASVEQIDAIMEKAWQNKERWKEMGEASYQMFKEKFPEDVSAYFLNQVSK